MLNIHNLSVSFSGEYLFEEISSKLEPKDWLGFKDSKRYKVFILWSKCDFKPSHQKKIASEHGVWAMGRATGALDLVS